MNIKYNPFSPSGIVPTNLFGGRKEYIFHIVNKLYGAKNGAPSSFYFIGERGIGKTALAKLIRFITEAKDKDFGNLNFLTSYYSVQKGQSIKDVLQASLNNLADSMDKSLLEKVGARVGKLFSNGKFSIGAFGLEASLELDKSDSKTSTVIKDQFVSISRNILKEIKVTFPHDGLFIIIDEMDQLNDISDTASILRGITTTLSFEDFGNISFLLIGYKEGYDRFVEGDPSVARLIDPIHLSVMPDDEVKETLEKGFQAAKVKYVESVLSESSRWTGGYPLAIQTLGYNLIEADQDHFLDLDDWGKAIESCQKELSNKEFSQYYSFGSKKKTNSDKILITLSILPFPWTKSSLQNIEQFSGVKGPVQYITKLKKSGAIKVDNHNNLFSLKNSLLSLAIRLDARSTASEYVQAVMSRFISSLNQNAKSTKKNKI